MTRALLGSHCTCLGWHKRKGKGMPPALPGTVLERKSKAISAQKVKEEQLRMRGPLLSILKEEEK
jgi:hypothetical protein